MSLIDFQSFQVRMAIAEDPDQKTLLHSLVEVDEAYLGSRPRKENERDDDNPEKPGRGRRKGAVVSIAEHSRRPIARVAKKRGSSTKRLFKLVAKIPAPMSHLAADQFGGRRLIARLMSFVVINIGSHLLIGALTYKSSRDSGLW